MNRKEETVFQYLIEKQRAKRKWSLKTTFIISVVAIAILVALYGLFLVELRKYWWGQKELDLCYRIMNYLSLACIFGAIIFVRIGFQSFQKLRIIWFGTYKGGMVYIYKAEVVMRILIEQDYAEIIVIKNRRKVCIWSRSYYSILHRMHYGKEYFINDERYVSEELLMEALRKRFSDGLIPVVSILDYSPESLMYHYEWKELSSGTETDYRRR